MVDNNCQWVAENMPAYEDGELTTYEKVRVEGHLSHCGRCAAEAKDFQKSWALFQESNGTIRTPDNLRRKVAEAVVPVMTSRLFRTSVPSWFWPIAISACCAMTLSLRNFTKQHSRSIADISPERELWTSPNPNIVERTLDSRKPQSLAVAWAEEIGGVPHE